MRNVYEIFLYISLGSLSELETQIMLSKDLGFINESNNMEEHILRVKQMLLGLIKHLEKRNK